MNNFNVFPPTQCIFKMHIAKWHSVTPAFLSDKNTETMVAKNVQSIELITGWSIYVSKCKLSMIPSKFTP